MKELTNPPHPPCVSGPPARTVCQVSGAAGTPHWLVNEGLRGGGRCGGGVLGGAVGAQRPLVAGLWRGQLLIHSTAGPPQQTRGPHMAPARRLCATQCGTLGGARMRGGGSLSLSFSLSQKGERRDGRGGRRSPTLNASLKDPRSKW